MTAFNYHGREAKIWDLNFDNLIVPLLDRSHGWVESVADVWFAIVVIFRLNRKNMKISFQILSDSLGQFHRAERVFFPALIVENGGTGVEKHIL